MMAPRASNHTILVNQIISLLTPNKGWPSSLYDMGLKLALIEETFNVGTQGRNPCNPDLVCSNSPKNNILLFECKGGKNVEKKQLETYLLITPSDVNRLVTVDNPNKLAVFFAYAARDFSSIKESILKTLSEIRDEGILGNVPSDIDILESNDNTVKVHPVSNYDWEINLVSGIPVHPWTFSMNFYPFSSEDDSEFILSHIIRSVIHLLSKKNPINPNNVALSPDEVTQDLFDSVYAYISFSKKRELLASVSNCFTQLLREKKLKNKIFRIGKRGTSLSFNMTEGILEDLKDLAEEIEAGQKQTRIDDFF
jgi:hypothetical protein